MKLLGPMPFCSSAGSGQVSSSTLLPQLFVDVAVAIGKDHNTSNLNMDGASSRFYDIYQKTSMKASAFLMAAFVSIADTVSKTLAVNPDAFEAEVKAFGALNLHNNWGTTHKEPNNTSDHANVLRNKLTWTLR